MNTILFSCSYCSRRERESDEFPVITCADCGHDSFPVSTHDNSKLIRKQENERSGHEVPYFLTGGFDE